MANQPGALLRLARTPPSIDLVSTIDALRTQNRSAPDAERHAVRSQKAGLMSTLVAQIAPQRSTQYSALADALASQELLLSPLGQHITNMERVEIGGEAYLRFDMPVEPGEDQVRELGQLAMTQAFFVYYDRLGEVEGPLLRPIDPHVTRALPETLVTSRRYKGKTNELFTHFMCNVARFSNIPSGRPWDTLRVFDPLAGGGTTLFTALVLGASVAGVEKNATDVESTAAFVRNYAREQGITCSEKQEKVRGIGKRWVYTIGKGKTQQCVLAHGDTADSVALISGFRPHLIVTDLPYGIQHKGELVSLLSSALPVWASLLPPGGAMVLSWESRPLSRADLVALVESASPLVVLQDPPYLNLAHRVDRVIKQRDVLVARRPRSSHSDDVPQGPIPGK
jgi:hypothetical protein